MDLFRRANAHLSDAVRIAPARPALASGIRAAVAAVVPLVIGQQLHLAGATWASLGGFLVAIADKGGPYRTRAKTMGALTAAAALSGAVAALAGAHLWSSVALMFVWGLACGLARVYGPDAGSVGSYSAVIFVASLANPASGMPLAAERALEILVGGLWAMSLSLLLWPIRFYRPARMAIARCFGLLTTYADEAGHRDWGQLARERHPAIRDALEISRTTLAVTRRGRQGESWRGEQLLLMQKGAEQLFGMLVALGDLLDSLGSNPDKIELRAEIDRVFSALPPIAAEVQRVLETEGAHPTDMLVVDAFALGAGPAADPARRYASDLVTRGREVLISVLDAARALEGPAPEDKTRPTADRSEPKPDRWAPLRENLNWTSVVFRHALRVGTVASLAVLITGWAGIDHGHWVTLAVIIILQPYTGATTVKGVQRVLGTIIGGALAAVLAATVHDPIAVDATMFILAAVGVSLLPFNYGVYSVFLTPTFVLLVELRGGDWHLAVTRIANTLLGSGLAFAGARYLWPSPERVRFPSQMGAALDATADYYHYISQRLSGAPVATGATLEEMRRRTGLTMMNADASLQRLLAESRQRPEQMERFMTLLLQTRRLGTALTALAHVPSLSLSPAEKEQLAALDARIRDGLTGAAALLRGDSSPSGPVDLAAPRPTDVLLASRLERVARLVADVWEAAAQVTDSEA